MKGSTFKIAIILLLSLKFSYAQGLKGTFQGIVKGMDVKAQKSQVISSAFFDPVLEVNTNRGSYSTSISIQMPSNLLFTQSLTLGYNNNNAQNIGMGIGWGWNLPFIDNSDALLGKERYTVSGPLDSSDIVEVDEDLKPLKKEIDSILNHFNTGI